LAESGQEDAAVLGLSWHPEEPSLLSLHHPSTIIQWDTATGNKVPHSTITHTRHTHDTHEHNTNTTRHTHTHEHTHEHNTTHTQHIPHCN
jgi:hypothetical protein